MLECFVNVAPQPVLLPRLPYSSSFFYIFRKRSNKISPLFCWNYTLSVTLAKISHLFSNTSQKHPGVRGVGCGLYLQPAEIKVSLSKISRDNQLRFLPDHKIGALFRPGVSLATRHPTLATVSQAAVC